MSKTKQTVLCVKAENISLPKSDFNIICDTLKQGRPWSHDYRIVSDYDGNGYWESQTYYDFDAILIDAVLADTKETVATFCKKHNLPMTAVNVRICTYALS